MWSSARRSACALFLGILVAGCAREATDVREVREATQDYLRALARRDVKGIAERSTCVASTNSFAGGRVLRVEPTRWVRMGTVDSLSGISIAVQRAADSIWAYAKETTADSLFRRARQVSNQSAVYRNAARAVLVSAPGAVVGRDSMLETRLVHARFRYAGPFVGPRPVDREEIIRLLRVPGGRWVVFSVYIAEDDPRPEMI